MFRCVLAIIALAVGLSSGVGAASKWVRVKSANFSVLGDGNPRTLKQVALRFEQFREVFARVFPKSRQAPPSPISVFVFGSERAYQPFMPLYNGKRVEVGGMFVPGAGATHISLRSDLGDSAYPVVFHEYTHMLVENLFADVPVWFNEGLAEYYSTFAMMGDQEATIGKVHEAHVNLLRERFLPLSELIAVKHDSPLYNEGNRRTIFYAESWAFVHYLLIGNPARRPQLAVFLEKQANGVPVAQGFQEAFGVDEATLERELRSYVQRSVYQSQQVTFADKLTIDGEFVVEPLSDADADAALADLLLHMNRLEDAGVRAQRATGLVRDHPRGLAVLGRVKNRQGQHVLARSLLEEATKGEPNDYVPYYYRALTLLRPDAEKGAAAVERDVARTAAGLLEKAIAIQPDHADAQMLLAYARLIASDPAGAVAPAMAAYKLSPRHEYGLMLAQAQVGAGSYDQARPLLDSLAEHGSTSEIRETAGELRKRVHLLEKVPRGRLPTDEASKPEAAGKPEPAAEEPPPPRSMLVLRELEDGETRVEGTLTAIECAKGRITLQVQTADGPLALEAVRFEDVEFISYRDDLRGQVKCGARTPAESGPGHVARRHEPLAEARRCHRVHALSVKNGVRSHARMTPDPIIPHAGAVADRRLPRSHPRTSRTRARGRDRRPAGSGQDDARAAGAHRTRAAPRAAAAARGGARHRSPHCRRAGLDARRRSGLARQVRVPRLAGHARARRHRGHSHCAAPARSAASEFATIVLDEFHERSIHADLGLALARQAWQARDDLRLVVMSATIDAGPVAAFLGNCPIVDVPGRPHPLEIAYAPGETVGAAVARAATQSARTCSAFCQVRRRSGVKCPRSLRRCRHSKSSRCTGR